MNRPSTFTRRKRLFIGGAMLALLGALFWFLTTSWLYLPMLAYFKSREHFTHCVQDSRILCEPGSQALAGEVARHLDGAIATIKRAQFGVMAAPVVVYTYATHESFAAFTGVPQARAAVFNGALHMSPLPLQLSAGLGPTLVHEMSHLQLNLALGNWAFGVMPAWFTEGLATHVSEGAGAELATQVGAIYSMAEGKCFEPTSQGSRFAPMRRIPGVKSIDMFYRQGAMFVAYLERHDPIAYERMLAGIASKQSVGEAANEAYGAPLAVLWTGFLENTRADYNRSAAFVENRPLCTQTQPR